MNAPQTQKRNLAARMALWSAHHRKKAIFGWLAFVIVIFAISKVAITQQTIVFETAGPGESGRADTILYEDFKQPASEAVLIQNPQLRAGSPAFRAVVKSVIDGVTPLPAVAKVESPFDVEDNSGLISDDQHSVLVPVEIKGLSDDASDKVDPIVDRVTEIQKANPGFTIGSFGASTEKALYAAFMDDLLKAGAFSIPLTLIILLVAFGALVAAGIPLLLGLTAVLGTMGLVAIISQALPMSDSVSAIILLIGLAVGVDYTMFYLKREREERAAGRSEEAALEAAAATSGRSVLISGCTVLVAMAGMLLTFDPGFASFGVATMTVVAVAMLGSLTVLPALLSKLGDNVGARRARIMAGACRPSTARFYASSPRSHICTLVSAPCSLRQPGVLARPWRRCASGRPDGCTKSRGVAGGLTRRRGACPSRAGSTTSSSISGPTSWRSHRPTTRSATRASRRCARRSSRLRWTGRGRCGRSSWSPGLRTGGWEWSARSTTRSSTVSLRCRS